jgi:hypothetical protein
MADGIDRQLEAIHAATAPTRWKLLRHAVTIGPFAATEAAEIANLPPESGNARSTHAERLREVKLLERERGRAVRYRATPGGHTLYSDLAAVVAKEPNGERTSKTLARGEHFDLTTEVQADRRRRRPVIFRITRVE